MQAANKWPDQRAHVIEVSENNQINSLLDTFLYVPPHTHPRFDCWGEERKGDRDFKSGCLCPGG